MPIEKFVDWLEGVYAGQWVPISRSLDNDQSMRAGIETGSQGIALLCSYPGYVAGSAGPIDEPYHERNNLALNREI